MKQAPARWIYRDASLSGCFAGAQTCLAHQILVWAVLIAIGGAISTGPLATAARAQGEGDELEAVEDLEMLDDSSVAPPAPTTSATTSDGNAEERSLLDTLIDGGLVGLLIGLLSVVSLGFIIEHSMSIRKSTLIPEDVADELEGLIQQGKVDAAIEASEDPNNESLIADVVLAGLRRYKASEFGFAEYKAAVEEAGEDQTGRLYRKTEVLGVIGAIAPMLGLTGTVLGMIEAFNKIASTGGAARPDELAGGIGKALVTTLMGLIVAIPTMIAFSFFRNKIDSIVAEAGKRVEQIMMPLGRRRQQ
jgi:biopolymer transport protein ExbB